MCYNGKRIVIGGTNGIVYGSIADGFTVGASSNLMTAVNGLASNSEYGHVHIPSGLHLDKGNKLDVVYPRNINKNGSNIAIDFIGEL